MKYFDKLVVLFCRFFIKPNKNLFLFSSFYGAYSDNPKYISREIHKLDNSKKIYWLLNDVENTDLPGYIHAVKINSIRGRVLEYRAGVIVDNNYGNRACVLLSDKVLKRLVFKIRTFFKSKPGQIVFTTWHGVPFKKIGADSENRKTVDFSCSNLIMVLGDEHTANVMRRITFNKIPIKLIGTPRDDLLYRDNFVTMKKKIGLEEDRKYILFAPSFREKEGADGVDIERSGLQQLSMLDVEELLDALGDKFGGEWSLICRFHYHVEKNINWVELQKKYGNKIVNGNKCQDMTEYLSCVDALMTDVSSCMFDYAVTNKPVFLFFPDIEEYKKSERGVYMKIDDLAFPYATDFYGLLSIIKNFNAKRYKVGLKKMKKDLGYIENPQSARDVAKYILESIDEK